PAEADRREASTPLDKDVLGGLGAEVRPGSRRGGVERVRRTHRRRRGGRRKLVDHGFAHQVVSAPERLRLTTTAASEFTTRVMMKSTKPAVSSAEIWMPVASPN